VLLGLESGDGGFCGECFRKRNIVSPECTNLLMGHLGQKGFWAGCE
jgi:hypothetical protein